MTVAEAIKLSASRGEATLIVRPSADDRLVLDYLAVRAVRCRAVTRYYGRGWCVVVP